MHAESFILASRIARYGVVLPIVLAFASLQLALLRGPVRAPFVGSFIAVALAASLGGLGPGLLAVMVSAPLSRYLWMDPQYTLSTTPEILRALLAYTIGSVVIAALCAGFRSALLRTTELAGIARREHELLRAVLDALPVGVFICDRQGGILETNSAAARIWGPPADARSVEDYKRYRATFHDTGRELGPEDWAGAVSLRTGRPCLGQVLDVDRFDAGRSTLLNSAAPLLGPGGEVTGVVVVNQDISPLIEAERRVRGLNAMLSESQRIAHVGSFEIDPVLRTSVFSEELHRIFGMDPESRVDLGAFYERVHPEDRERARESLARTIDHGEPTEIRYRVQWSNGETRTVLRRARRERDPETDRVRVVGIIQDITDQVEWERRLLDSEKLESLSVLAGGIAHDFNNLLTGVMGNAELALLEGGITPGVRRAIEDILVAGNRAADLAQQMLAYSGRGHFAVRAVPADALVEETTRLLRAAVPKGVTLAFHAESGGTPVRADPVQFQRVLLNLVLNAAEATGPRGGEVAVLTDVVDIAEGAEESASGAPLPRGRYLRVRVEDAGHGMDEATVRRVFEPFFSTKFTGRGLGMAAVHGILRAHGAAITISTAPGSGTTVCVLWPLADEPGSADAARRPDAAAVGHPCVLVVDDEETVRSTTRSMLERKGFRVITAADGEEALDLLLRGGRDIRAVLLDMTMPKMNGSEVLRELRKVRPDLPVLVMSGYSEEQVLTRFGEEGRSIAAFLPKPLNFHALESHLARVCERRRTPRGMDH